MNSLPSKKHAIIQGKSAGIFENAKSPITLFRKNLESIEEIIECMTQGYQKVCFVGSSCMYPDKNSALVEDDLGTGSVYPTNALFSYGKLMGWQLCRAISEQLKAQYFVAIPSDIFGDPKDTHFIAQIMKRFHVAKEENHPKVTLFGTGSAIRHPIYDEDYKEILHRLMEDYEDTKPINIATPVSYAKRISSIVQDIREVVGYKGDIEWNAAYSDGQLFKVLNNDKLTGLLHPDFTPWMKSLELAYKRMLHEA